MRRGLMIVVFAALVVPWAPSRAHAHTPHDSADIVVVAADYPTSGRVFATVQDGLVRSDDRGATWQRIVNGITGDAVRRIAVTEAAPERVYVTTDVGVFRSDDGGNVWFDVSGDLPAAEAPAVAVSPDDPDIVLVATAADGLHRTDDGGENWTPVEGVGRVRVAEFGAAGTNVVVVGTATGRVHRSDDAGRTWVSTAADLGSPIRSLAVGRNNLIYVGGSDGGLLRSTDGGAGFEAVGNEFPADQAVRAVVLSTTEDQVWAVAATDGVYRSDDGGETWTHGIDGLTTDPQAEALEVANFTDLDAGTTTDGDTILHLTAFDGFFRSDDGGDTWQAQETLADMIVGLAVSPSYDLDGTVAVTTYVKGAYISTDEGQTFVPGNGGLAQPLGSGNKLLPVIRLHNVEFSPDFANDNTIYSATWTHLLVSNDAGLSWQTHFVDDAPADTQLRQFIIALSPQFDADGTMFLGTRQGTVYESTDRGADQTFTAVGSVDGHIRTMVLHPDFATTPTIFAAADTGVFRSTDAGRSWTLTSGPAGSALLSISPDFDNDQTVFAGSPTGLYVSRDGADTWAEVDDPVVGRGGVEAVGTSPAYADDQLLLISVRGSGLHRSTDGGRTFHPVGQGLAARQHLLSDFNNPSGSPIEFSPAFADDRTVYGFSGGTVLRSTDAGETWDEVAMPPASAFIAAESVAVPQEPRTASNEVEPQTVDDGNDNTLRAVGLGLALLVAAGGAVFARRLTSNNA
ncbi:MAG: VPS10 domain-containing protein [Acidimicrobiales bacterium]